MDIVLTMERVMLNFRISTLFIFFLCSLAISNASLAATDGSIKLAIAGHEVNLSHPCWLADGTVYFPIDALPLLGARMETDSNHHRNGQSIRIIPAVEKEFTEHARLVEGELMLPIEELAKKLAIAPEWCADTRTLKIRAQIDHLEFDGSQIRAVTSFPIFYDIYWWKGAKKLIVDLHGVQLPEQLPDAVIKNTTDIPIRTGMLSDGETGRIVLDMPGSVRYRKGTFGKTDKVRVDIYGYSRTDAPQTSTIHRPGTLPIPEIKPLPTPQHAESGTTVTGIECKKLDRRHVEVHVAASGPITCTTSMLRDPYRLVVDIPKTTLAHKIADIQANQGALRGIRVGQFDDSTVRMTMDLSAFVLFNVVQGGDAGGVSIDLQLPKGAGGTLDGKVIVIDPGHGGRETGAIGCCGTLEKDVTLAIAKRVKKLLADSDACPFLTRESDIGLIPSSLSADLAERVDFAARHSADIFVSIHCNSCTVPNSLSGTETYYHAQDASSKELAECVHEELIKTIALHNRGVKSDTVRFASGMAVLRHSTNKYHIPAILVETGFINNATEESKLTDPEFQQKIAEGIVKGLKLYVEGSR
jgi:N-acetylmuramoyl-L-alanine amidase